MSKEKIANVNLIIVCNDSKYNDELTFLTWYSFNKFFSGIKCLILKSSRKNSNINYWINSFKIHCKLGNFKLDEIKNFEFLDDSYFVIKAGIIFLKSEVNLENSFNFFDNKGIFYNYKKFNFEFDDKYLIGKLEDDFSSIFVDLNPWIEKLNEFKLIDRLSLCYGEPEFINGKGTPNEVNFGGLLKDAQKIYNNFPEVLNV